MRNLTRLALLALGLVVAKGGGQNITVRLLDGKSGEPIRGKEIDLSFATELPGMGKFVGPSLEAVTGNDGRAVFYINDLPAKFLIVSVPLHRVGCSTAAGFASDEVLRAGIVTENECDRKKKLQGKISAKPGEIVIFERNRNLLEKLLSDF